MPTFREFKSRRPNRILYDTITFYNPAFGYIRLVDKQIFSKTFAGEVYTPCRMEITESQQSSTPVINSTLKFARMAQDFKQQLNGRLRRYCQPDAKKPTEQQHRPALHPRGIPRTTECVNQNSLRG